jgi:hypothetical protein
MTTTARRLRASRRCLRCGGKRRASAFRIATHVEDRCIAARELERRELLGGTHPDLERKGPFVFEPQYVKSLKALRIIARTIIKEPKLVLARSLDVAPRNPKPRRQSIASLRKVLRAA